MVSVLRGEYRCARESGVGGLSSRGGRTLHGKEGDLVVGRRAVGGNFMRKERYLGETPFCRT